MSFLSVNILFKKLVSKIKNDNEVLQKKICLLSIIWVKNKENIKL